MQITKFQHACFVAEEDSQALVVDPGTLSNDFEVPDDPVCAVVITHVHGDHVDQDKLQAIAAQNPGVIVYGHQEVIDELDQNTYHTEVVSAGDMVEVGPFTLEFNGGEHALIHDDVPMCANLGVMINSMLYYPGDSFTMPQHDVEVLALPVAAPWMKTAEAMDYLTSVAPKTAFATHDAVLSNAGKSFTDNWMRSAAEKIGCDYRRLDNMSFVVE